jgi:hypothetical protein
VRYNKGKEIRKMKKMSRLLSAAQMKILQSRIDYNNITNEYLQSNFYQFYLNDAAEEKVLLGYVQPSFLQTLQVHCAELYAVNSELKCISMQPSVAILSPEEKSSLIHTSHEAMLKKGLITGWRNELFPVITSFNGFHYYLIERALVPYFGFKAYGVHMNGYCCKNPSNPLEITHLWIGRRSPKKQTWPGMLDHIVGGGLPYNIKLKENLQKECLEEASIPVEFSENAKCVSCVSYYGIDELKNLKRDVIFCYDLQLPNDFQPTPNDQEVTSFECQTIDWIIDTLITSSPTPTRDIPQSIVVSDNEFKPNCYLVIIDFLIR